MQALLSRPLDTSWGSVLLSVTDDDRDLCRVFLAQIGTAKVLRDEIACSEGEIIRRMDAAGERTWEIENVRLRRRGGPFRHRSPSQRRTYRAQDPFGGGTPPPVLIVEKIA